MTLGTLPDTVQAAGVEAKGKAMVGEFGLSVRTLATETAEKMGYGKDVKGVLIVDVDTDSDAFENGVRKDMVVTHVGGKPVATAEEFRKAVSNEQAKSGVRLRLTNPKGGVWFIFVTPKK